MRGKGACGVVVHTLEMGGCGESSVATAKTVLGNIPCLATPCPTFVDDFEQEGEG